MPQRYTQKTKSYDYYDKSITELEGHALVANQEMGVIKTDIKWIKEDILEIKVLLKDNKAEGERALQSLYEKLDKIKPGYPAWITVVTTILAALVVFYLTK